MDMPPNSIKRLMELEAVHLVARVLGGDAKSCDVPGPGAINGTHDFDVTLPNGRIVALEVTTAAHRRMIGTLAAFGQLTDAKYPSLKYNWSLTDRHADDHHRDRRFVNSLSKVMRSCASLRWRTCRGSMSCTGQRRPSPMPEQ